MSRNNIAIIVVIGLVAIVGARSADAGGRVVVMKVDGDRNRQVEKALAGLIEDDHEVVSSRDFARAAKKARVRQLNTRGISKVAKRMSADAVVQGDLDRARKGYVLTVRVRTAAGKTTKKLSVDLKRPKLTKTAKRRLGQRMLAALDDISGSDGRDAATDDDSSSDDSGSDSSDDAMSAEDAETRDAAEAKVAMLAGSRDGDDDDDDVDSLAARSDGPSRRVTMNNAPIRLDVGPSFTGRSLTFTSRAGLGADSPVGYTSSPVPGARISAEVYPGEMLGQHGLMAKFGMAVEYDRTLSLTTSTEDAADVALPTVQQRLSIGARFRHAFGDGPIVTAHVGYGLRDFTVDRSALPAGVALDLPDVSYAMVDPGVAVRMPLGAKAAVHAATRGLIILSSGAIQTGEEYGTATVTGMDASIGADYQLTNMLVLGVSASFTRIGFAFQGDGAQANGRDGDTSSIDVGGAADQYYGGAATLGVIF